MESVKLQLNYGRDIVHYSILELEELHRSFKEYVSRIKEDHTLLRSKIGSNDFQFLNGKTYRSIHYQTSGNPRWGSKTRLYRSTLGTDRASRSNGWTSSVHSVDYSRGIVWMNDADIALDKYIKKNEEFLKHARRGKLKSADRFNWLTEEIDTDGVLADFKHTIFKNLKHICDRCELEVNPDRMALHQLTLKCIARARLKVVERRGLKLSQDKQVIMAVERGVIDGEMVPIKYNIYVPEWVINAHKIYAGKDGTDAYANLDFDEYIINMKPEKVE